MADKNRSHTGAAGGGAVYGLGLIGARDVVLGRPLRCLPGAGLAGLPRLRATALVEAVGIPQKGTPTPLPAGHEPDRASGTPQAARQLGVPESWSGVAVYFNSRADAEAYASALGGTIAGIAQVKTYCAD